MTFATLLSDVAFRGRLLPIPTIGLLRKFRVVPFPGARLQRTMTPMDIASVARIDRAEAPVLAATEYRRMAALAERLVGEDWVHPTDCPDWTVRQIVAHVAGSMAGTSLREGFRQRRSAGSRSATSGRNFLDEMNQLHIDDRAEFTEVLLIRELRDRISPAVRARRRVPELIRRVPIPNSGGRLTLAQLLDVILTRDVWMHRVDICRATHHRMRLTPDHDGRLVADVVREWADRHGQPFTLCLTGEAGGEFSRSGDGPKLELDAVEFCRALSGRAPVDGLFSTEVVF